MHQDLKKVAPTGVASITNQRPIAAREFALKLEVQHKQPEMFGGLEPRHCIVVQNTCVHALAILREGLNEDAVLSQGQQTLAGLAFGRIVSEIVTSVQNGQPELLNYLNVAQLAQYMNSCNGIVNNG